MVEQWNSVEEQCGTVWNNMVEQWNSVAQCGGKVEQFGGMMKQCGTMWWNIVEQRVWWNSPKVWWNSVEQYETLWCNSGTV